MASSTYAIVLILVYSSAKPSMRNKMKRKQSHPCVQSSVFYKLPTFVSTSVPQSKIGAPESGVGLVFAFIAGTVYRRCLCLTW